VSYICELVGGYWIILFIFFLFAAILEMYYGYPSIFFICYPEWYSLHYSQAKLYYLLVVIAGLGIMSIIGYIRFSHPGITELELTLENGNRQD